LIDTDTDKKGGGEGGGWIVGENVRVCGTFKLIVTPEAVSLDIDYKENCVHI